MNLSLAFVRIFFVILSIFFMTTYMVATSPALDANDIITGILLGVIFGGILIGLDLLFRRFNLRAFNIAVIGLFFGYLMGQALVFFFDQVILLAEVHASGRTLEIIKIFLYLFGAYLGIVLTLRGSDELYVSIPFVKFAPTSLKKKDILTDISILSDARIIDLAASGLLDHHLILPRFVIKEIYGQAESPDEILRARARRSLDVVKKLENIPDLHLRYNETDFPDVREAGAKLIRLARLIDANILTADISRVQMSTMEGVRVINIHSLSNALKPLTQTGEFIKVKVQRFGKEPRQGVGYLEDGTMVVINGGGDHIGATINVRVLSVKHTASGRMIFCNALDEEGEPLDEAWSNSEVESNNY